MAVPEDEPSVESLLDELPPSKRRAVEDFARFLLGQEKGAQGDRRLQLAWAGALAGYGDRVSSEDLEDRAVDLRRGKET